jgi:nitroreductase
MTENPSVSPEALESLFERSRSVRRFRENAPVERRTLEELVGLARLSPSGGNRQALRFLLSCERGRNGSIFPHLSWAGYLKGWGGPGEGERPAAYIVILGDREISKGFGMDHGIAAQGIMLGAAARGLGGCIVGSVDRKGLAAALGLPGRFEILLVIALGEPAERVVIEEATGETGIRYWRSEDGVHHVPKRKLTDLLFEP